MRAVIVKEPGGPEVLELGEVEAPVPGPFEVRVRVRAAGLNRADVLQRMGLYPPPAGTRADILGLEFAGKVERLGSGATRWKLGDRVMGIAAGAAHAELVVAHERMLLAVPPKLSDAEAAAIPEAFLTAHDALYQQAQLRADEALLIHAVGSGVGTAALQLAHAGGSRTLGTSRTADKLAQAAKLGLTHGILVGRDGLFSKKVLELTAGNGAAVIADFVGGPYLGENIRALALRGRLVSIGLLGGSRGELDLGQLMTRRGRIFGTTLRSRPIEEKLEVTESFARTGLPLFASGTVVPIVDRVFPAAEVRAAHERMVGNEGFGKLVLAF
jgi:putative PIG3 family NAD(P)H quinone oxidoreductase